MTTVHLTLAAILAVAAAAPQRRVSADPAPPPKAPMTKQQEREAFHPRALGMPPEPRLEGYARRLQMEKDSPLAGLPFRSVGPEIQGGRIVDIEGVASNEDALIVAWASGGVWRTDNRGGSWTPLFERESTSTIGDIAVADAEGRVIYVGSGENNSSRTSYAGTGVFKTTDGGKTWENVGLHDSHHVGRVVVDAKDPETVFVASMGHLYTESSERGVYKSTDGGRTWRRTLYVDDRTGAIDLAQHPTRPEVLVAAMWERARRPGNFLESGPGSGLFRSMDGGETWTRLAGGLPSGDTVGRMGVEFARSRPDTLYVVLDNQALRPESEPFDEEAAPGVLTTRRLGRMKAEDFARLDDATLDRFLRANEFPKALKARGLKRDVRAGKITVDDVVNYVKDANRDLFERAIVGSEIYRSDDGGTTWRRTHENRLEKIYYSYGYYFGRVHVDPVDSERVYFGGVPLLRSDDGGRTWKGLDRRGVHVDHHALYIDPRAPRRLALGNDGALNLSWDHGDTWTVINNVPVGQFTTIAVDEAEPYNIIGGTQDNGVLRGPSTYVPGQSDPAAWKEILGGDGSAVVVDPGDPNRVWTAFQFGHSFRLDLKTGQRTKVRPRHELTPEKKEPPLRYNWVTPFILSPHSRDILYYGANRVYRSFDRGDSWHAISEDLTTNPPQGDVPFGTLTTLSESPKRFGLVYAGTDDGKVWVTRDGGNNWTDLSAGLVPARWVSRVVASAHDEGTVYVAQNGYRDDDFAPYLFRSANYGGTWERIDAGLPAEPVNTVREDPKADHLLYVGTDLGAFASLDKGKTWLALAGGLPHVPVHDLAVQGREGDVVLGTHGRSVFVAEAAPLRKLTEEVQAKALHAFAVKKVTSSPSRGYGDHPWITWPRQEVVVRVPYWSKDGGATTAVVKDVHGSVWAELAHSGAAGLNVIEWNLRVEARRADAAEAAAKAKAGAARSTKKAAPTPPPAELDEEDEEDAAPTADAGQPALDAALELLLADPLRSTRVRYLPPGRYTIELRSGTATSTTRLRVDAPKTPASAAGS